MVINPETLSTIYWYCAIAGTIAFLLKTSLPIDGGGEVGGEFSSITDTDASFNFFTIESIAAFFMTGGWMGWAAFSHMHYELKVSLAVAVATGVLGMVFFSWLITRFKKLEHNPKVSLSELEGKKGKAYLQFSPKGSSKIQIEFNSKLEIVDARNNSDEEIKAFEEIKVVKVENDVVFIEKNS